MSFNCDQCDKVCKNKSGLTLHKRVHKQSVIEQPSVIVNSFNCDQCDKVCKSKSGLTVHKRVHKQIVNDQVVQRVVKSILSKQRQPKKNRVRITEVIEQQYVLEMNMPETVYEKCDYVFERESVEISTDCDASVQQEREILDDTLLHKSNCSFVLYDIDPIEHNNCGDWDNSVIVKFDDPTIIVEIPDPIVEYELRHDLIHNDLFRCLVCMESVEEIVKCPVCTAMYCDSCYDRCKSNTCAQCRQQSDLFTVDESESESEQESSDESMDLGDAEYEYGLFSFAIIRTYNQIRDEYTEQVGFNYTLSQVDDRFMRLFELIDRSERIGQQSVLRHLPILRCINVSTLQGAQWFMQVVNNIIDEFQYNSQQLRKVNMNLIYQFSRGNEQLFEDLIYVLTGEDLPEREPDESGMNE